MKNLTLLVTIFIADI